MCVKNPDAFSKTHRAVWSTGVAVTFGYTFAQPRATYSTHPMPVPGGYAFAHSDNSRAAVLSRSASSLCPPSGKTFPSLYGVHRRGTSVSFPYKTCGLDVCIISRYTQFVNRLILLFPRMYFLHSLAKRSPLPVLCSRILHAKDRVSSAGSDETRPFAVLGLGYRRNHVPERGLAGRPLSVIL